MPGRSVPEEEALERGSARPAHVMRLGRASAYARRAARGGRLQGQRGVRRPGQPVLQTLLPRAVHGQHHRQRWAGWVVVVGEMVVVEEVVVGGG